jgi:deoxyribose-phosphate aldolase
MNIYTYIDHTLLRPDATILEITKLCKEAMQYEFAAVCVPPHYVKLAKQCTTGSTVKTATVIGFPLGYSCIEAKIAEIRKAIKDNVDELDIVIHLCALKNGDFDYLSREITACLQPARLNRKIVKVIIESGILSDEEIKSACQLYARHKVDYVKTSTGYAETGATIDTIKLMRTILPDEISIKASGGIRTFAFASALIEAGASRIGTSASIALMEQ